jgi:predicted ATPase/DNA-binding CsgD family transcriptional regulator/DNA-binding XRE family transcriptional regulator
MENRSLDQSAEMDDQRSVDRRGLMASSQSQLALHEEGALESIQGVTTVAATLYCAATSPSADRPEESMSAPASFREHLRGHRRRVDLTQEQLAEQVGCAATTLRALERGRRRPSRGMAERIADVLRLNGDERSHFLRLARGQTLSAMSAAHSPDTRGREGASGYTPGIVPSPLPALPLGWIARPRLTGRLAAQVDGTVALLSAPPGFAKTTSLAIWARQHPHPVLWAGLTSADNGPQPLLRAIWSASGQPFPEELSLELVLRLLSALPAGSALILDDVHQLTNPTARALVASLVERLPARVRLLLATREDPALPLGRLRAQGRLLELRAVDLRFDHDEAAAFLRATQDLVLTPAQVASLLDRTEGWPACLRLAALSLRGLPPEQLDAFLVGFGGTSRFVGDYLSDEVLRRLPAHLRAFLLQTSILERLSPELCDAVLGVDAPRVTVSRLLLDELERANVFLLPLDHARTWYRYHGLFAGLLRAQLEQDALPAQVAALHQRAAGWLLAHGEPAAAECHLARADTLAPAQPGIFPEPASPLIGRATELAQLAALRDDPSCRLVTLVGPGGIGKTRLAMQAAVELRASFGAGAMVVPLEHVSDPAQLPAMLLMALGVSPGEDPPARLRSTVRERDQLVVLDNFEQLLPAAGLIVELLAAAPQLRLLVTSREPLRVADEMVVEVSGLGYADDTGAAAQLFRERVGRLRTGWRPTAEEQRAIVVICRMVEGMPLAIELAAGWSDVLSVPAIAAELARSLDLLERQSPDLPERHRSLRAVFEQSWARLDPPLRPVLARLALFPASFTREAAARVAGASLPQLAALLRQSLLRRDGERYTLHPAVRAYGAEHLASEGWGADAAREYVAFYCTLAADAGQGYRSAAQQYWLDHFPAEADNWAYAIALALEAEAVEAAATMSMHLAPLWRRRGMAGAALALAERTLAQPSLPETLRPAVLIAVSQLAYLSARWERAERAAGEAVVLAEARCDPLLRAEARLSQAAAMIVLRQRDAALPLLDESLAVFRAAGHALPVVRTLQQIADARLSLGDLAGTKAALEELLIRARVAGLVEFTLGGQIFLAELAFLRGDLSAVPQCVEALAGLAHLGDLHIVCFGLEVLGAYSGRKGCHDAGVRLVAAATELRRAINEPVPPNFTALTEGYRLDARGPLDLQVIAELEAEGAQSVRRHADGTIAIEPLLAFVAAQLARIPPVVAPPSQSGPPLETSDVWEPLSARELEVLQLLADGASNQQIADGLLIALGTVKRHLNTIFAKLAVQSRTQAIARARKLGLLVGT